MTQEECPFRSSKVLHDGQGDFHLCNREGGDCECIPSGCPYLIAKNSKLNLPDLPGYVQIDDEQGVCIDSLQVQESCKENTDSFTDDLEEAAEEYAGVNYDCETETDAFYHHIQKEAFIEGAKWREQQMMKDYILKETVKRIARGSLGVQDFIRKIDKYKKNKQDDRPRD